MILKELGSCSLIFQPQVYVNGGPYFLSAREKENGSFWQIGSCFMSFLKHVGFYLTARNSLIVQVEVISGYLYCLLESGEEEFPLDRTDITIFWNENEGCHKQK